MPESWLAFCCLIVQFPPPSHTHAHTHARAFTRTYKCEIQYAKGWNFTQSCLKIGEYQPNRVLCIRRSHTVRPHFNLLPLEGSALCCQARSSVTSVCQYGQNCVLLTGCQTIENLLRIDIHLRMEVAGMCRHRYCSTLGCCLRRLKAWCIQNSCPLAQPFTMSGNVKH
jgi:hypothetical protein